MTVPDEMLSADHHYPQQPALPENQVVLQVKERPKGLDEVEVHLVDSVQDAMDLMHWLSNRREVLAVDTETTGFNAWDGDLRLVQIGDEMHGWSIPWHQWGGVFVDAMRKYQGPITFHNAAFDARWLSVHTPWEVPWHRTHDTMIMAHVIDPTSLVGLKHLSDRFIDRRASAGEAMLKAAFSENKWDWATVPIDFGPYWQYGALDTVLTARLWSMFRADKRYPHVYELEMGVRRVCSQMEDAGSPIDVAYCANQYERLGQYVDATKEWWQENHGINVGSSKQLIKFFTDIGCNIDRHTKSGAPSLDKVMLGILAKEHELANNVLAMRKAEKMQNTYFKNFIDENVEGVLHPQIRTLGARTGRMSITKPALQTLPKGEPTIRNAFIAREGEVLISADYDQVEMRLMAHFSQDPGLASAFASDEDFFVTMARQVFNDPTIDKKHPLRSRVKGVSYGKAYGAGISTMAETAGLRFEQMKPSVDAFDQTYPGVLKFQKAIEQMAGERERAEGIAYVLTPFGRRLPADSGRNYTLVNYLLQSHAAEVLKRAILNLDNAGLGPNMILPVHDELIFSVPKDSVNDVTPIIRDCMEMTHMEGGSPYLVPLTVGIDGPYARWGEKYV